LKRKKPPDMHSVAPPCTKWSALELCGVAAPGDVGRLKKAHTMSRLAIVSAPTKQALPRDAPPPAPHRFLALRDVLSRLTISRSMLYELIHDPDHPFPAPVHIGRRSVWVEGEVEEYMRSVIESEDRGQ
jgi:predicted DNA-binding transcriptional regulator AlpA